MESKSYSEYEKTIEARQEAFVEALKQLLELVLKNKKPEKIRKQLTEVNGLCGKLFGEFENSITDLGYPYYDQHPDVRDSKLDDAIALSDTLVNYWGKHIVGITKKYNFTSSPKPSSTAYGVIQRFIMNYNEEKALKIKEEFIKVNLPVHGFDQKPDYTFTDPKSNNEPNNTKTIINHGNFIYNEDSKIQKQNIGRNDNEHSVKSEKPWWKKGDVVIGIIIALAAAVITAIQLF